MFVLGERIKGKEIGYASKTATYIWSACLKCCQERWVLCRYGQPIHKLCLTCAKVGKIFNLETRQKMSLAHKARYVNPSLHPAWKGGRLRHKSGYIQLWTSPNDFFFHMADRHGYVMEHRLVMA